jgi:hypothetical protein
VGEGRDREQGVVLVDPQPAETWRTEVTRLAWVSRTPFGSPVVPLE